MKKLLTLLFLCVALFSNATIFYIDPSGNDATGTGAIGNPWKTLSKATTAVTTVGDIIHVNAGTYVETVQCNLAAGVSIEGDGVTSIIKNNITTDWISILKLSSVSEGTDGNQHISNVKFDGQFTTGATGSAIAVEVIGRKNVSIHDNTFIDCRMRGINFAGRVDNNDGAPTIYATGNSFYNNIVTNCAEFNHSLTAGFGCLNIGGQQGMLIYNNKISQTSRPNGYNGWPIKYFNGGYLNGCKIYNNTINKILNYTYLGGDNWDFAIELFNESGLEIYSNTITGGGIDINFQTIGSYAFSAWIHDNTIVMPSQNTYLQTGITVEVNTDGVIIEKNIIDKVGVGILFTPRPGNLIKNIVIRNNLITNIGMAEGTGFAIHLGQTTNANFKNITIYNNTFLENNVTPTWWGINLPSISSGSIDSIFIKNNIMNGTISGAVVQGGSTVAITNLNISYNNFYLNGTNGLVLDGGSPTPGAGYINTNNLSVNPSFGSTGYKLVAGSALVDAGTNVGLPFLGAAPDINWTDSTAAAPPVLCNSWNTSAVAAGGTLSGGNLTISVPDYSNGGQVANGVASSGSKVCWKITVNSVSTADNTFGLGMGITNGLTAANADVGFDGNSWVLRNDGLGYHTGFTGNTNVTGGQPFVASGQYLLTLDQTGATASLDIYKKITGVWTLIGNIYNNIPLGNYNPIVGFRQGASVTADFATTDTVAGFSSICSAVYTPTVKYKRKLK